MNNFDFTDNTIDSLLQTNQDVPNVPTRRLSGISDRFLLLQRFQKLNTTVANLKVTVDEPAGTPNSVSGVSATESPYKTPTGQMVSDVSVSFVVNPSDTFFFKAQVWFVGYNGNPNPQLMADGTASPVSFLTDTTHETVTVYVVTVGTTGLPSSDVLSAPNTTVTLDGVVSAPPAPSVSQSLTSTPTGYQFSFNYLTGLSADLVDGYKVYRNTVNNTSTATQFAFFKHNPLNIGTQVVQDDGVPNGTIYWYWVSAINTSSLESSLTSVPGSGTIISGLAPTSDNMVRNGTFSGGGTNWLNSRSTAGISTSNFLNGVSGLPSGNSEFKSAASTLIGLEAEDFIPVDPSKTYLLSAWVKIPSFTSVNYAGFSQYDSSKNWIDHVNGSFGYCLYAGLNVSLFSSWQYFSRLIGGNPASGSASATQFTTGTAFIRPVFLINWTGTTTPVQVEITDVRLSIVEAVSIKALMSTPAGVNLISNSDFNNGVTTFITGSTTGTVGVYDNASSGKVTHTMTTDATAPNTSGKVLQITTAAGTPTPSPGWGGFFYGLGVDSGSIQLGQYHKGDTILWRIRAKIPQGYSLQNASNAFGTEGTIKWITSQAGYGDWYTYLMEQTIGTTGTFSSIGFFNLDNTSSAPVTWNVASVEALDLSVENISSAAGYHLFRQGGSTFLLTQGSIVPTQAFQISWSATSTTISLSWSSTSLLRSDGSSFTVSTGSASFTVSASLTYFLYPYITYPGGLVQFANGNPPPTSPSYTFAAQQGLDGRISLTPLTIQSASGGTPNTGTGGDGGSCPEESELVEVQGRGLLPAGQVMTGDYVKGFSFHSNSDVYRRVIAIIRRGCAAWRIVEGHKVSPCEPVYLDGKWIAAYKVPMATLGMGVGVKLEITVEADENDEHNYWLVDGTPLLIHNGNILPRS
jgi:hypothetical protein